MPDMKYGDPAIGQKYSKIRDYVRVNQEAVREMHRQVGDLDLDERGIARRGLLIRHLVLPGGLAGTEVVARFLAEEISTDTYVNIMGQYRPEYKARREDFGDLSRAVTVDEIAEAYAIARAAGLHRFDQRRASWLVF
jgi:putative pyruvate formate lyase activating enzyme